MPSSEGSQNGGPHDCTHIRVYYSKVICSQAYTACANQNADIMFYLS